MGGAHCVENDQTLEHKIKLEDHHRDKANSRQVKTTRRQIYI